ncbi:hypothetical protein C8J57DRAFT_1067166 [Mycena rebaudengoi]|nr:hypothetical protein C8J57DRAFT_1067166 [Mycena rebaudengoi]
MLLLFFVVHALSAQDHPVPGHHLDSRAPIDSCDDINSCRKLFDIVWGCLATIFACTWVSVHPNVPPPGQSELSLFWRRLKMMFIAVIAPELMVGFAARQFFVARSYVKGKHLYDISNIHGFFISMGGFVSCNGHHPVTTRRQLYDIPEYLTDIRAVKVADIKDKSKGDALSKGVALIQGLWFTTQCLARVHQHLPVTELEVTTLAFAVVNIFIWLLWWNKPLDVQQPILVGPQENNLSDGGALYQVQPASITLLVGSSQKSLHEDDKPWHADSWNGISGALGGPYKDYKSTSYTSVPSFWSTDDILDKSLYPLFIEFFAALVFGAIHCAAWNTDFPSAEEMWMWRSCALLVAALPVIFTLAVILSDLLGEPSTQWMIVIYFTPISIYIIARLFLITLPLIALRALPPGALTDFNWSVYIPHL